MKRPIRWLLRIALGLFVLGIIAVVAFFLLFDNIVRGVVVRRLHSVTGMEVKMTAMRIGFRNPTITITGLKLYNTPEFGGALCLDIPEVHLEYDPQAMRAGSIHLPLLRLNLAQVGVVRDKKGKSNFDAIAKQEKLEKQSEDKAHAAQSFKFTGIDTLDFSFGKLSVSDLRSGREQEVAFNITNQVFHNVKSEGDLEGVAVLLALRSSSSTNHPDVDLDGLLKDLIMPPAK
ncbi:MAG TPA: hypothetical protein VGN61_09720 [Verrucomicrobiae bacterium]|jgi:uncharacterized protein involved in outer membrane biogenesis